MSNNAFILWIKRNQVKSIVIALFAYGVIAAAIDKPAEGTSGSSYASAPRTVNGSDAYGICTQIALQRYGRADFDIMQEIDMGGGEWIIHGTADIPGKRIYWVGNVKHNPAADKWDVIEFREK